MRAPLTHTFIKYARWQQYSTIIKYSNKNTVLQNNIKYVICGKITGRGSDM